MYPPVKPIIFEFGRFSLRWYGVLMATAVVVGAQISAREVQRRGQQAEDFWDMGIWVLIPAFIGARRYYVVIQSPRDSLGEYLANPITIIQVWNGGIHIFGGFRSEEHTSELQSR